MNEKLLEMQDIYKSFGNVQAISGGRFEQYRGEVHSLIGENGAGKSTMMKLLYGMYRPDSGKIIYEGKEYQFLDTKQAIGLGIGMVHQEFMLVDDMTVLENLILGFEPRKSIGRIDFALAREKIQSYIDTFKFDINLDKKIKDIPVGEAQRVEIIKALYRGANLLILDEPTAVLTPQESDKLFEIVEILKKDGKSIVFISHKLNEVMKISDRITVMRGGKYIDTVKKMETSKEELARLMVGHDVFLNKTHKTSERGEILLSVEDIYVPGDRELSKLRGVSFTMNRREILGIAGVDGNGQRELIEALTGIRPVQKGDIKLSGQSIANQSVSKIRKMGMAHIPEDRNTRGLNRSASILQNQIAVKHRDHPLSRMGIFHKKQLHIFSETLIDRFDIRPPHPDASTKHLSGGNAQKVVVSREIDLGADLLIAAQPTRGVDIGAIEQIRGTIYQAVEDGAGVLLISADLEEILALSDRIIVFYEGKIVGTMDVADATEETLGLLMTGGVAG